MTISEKKSIGIASINSEKNSSMSLASGWCQPPGEYSEICLPGEDRWLDNKEPNNLGLHEGAPLKIIQGKDPRGLVDGTYTGSQT